MNDGRLMQDNSVRIKGIHSIPGNPSVLSVSQKSYVPLLLLLLLLLLSLV